MGGLQPIHILIVAIAALVFFGGTKIPQFMRGLGQGTGEFKKGLEESRNDAPPPPPPAVAVTTTPVAPVPPTEVPK